MSLLQVKQKHTYTSHHTSRAASTGTTALTSLSSRAGAMVDGGRKPYVIAVVIQAIYTGLFVVSKAAFDNGINTYVFIFYRLAAATALLILLALISTYRSRSTTTPTPTPAMSCRLLFKLFIYALLGYIYINTHN